MIMEDGHFR
jgi:hypothetical protein